MISSTSLTNYDIKPTNFNGKLSSASAINATSPTLASTFYSLKRNSLNLSLSLPKPKTSSRYSSRFMTSNTCNQTDFYFKSLLRYVRSGNNDNFSEKLDFILKLCPQFYTNMSKLNPQYNSSFSNLNGDKNINNQKENKENHHQFFNHNNHFKINERNRWALIALLILIIEHNHSKNMNSNKIEKKDKQLNSELLNYLLAILESLPHIKWNEDFMAENSCEINGTSKIRKF